MTFAIGSQWRLFVLFVRLFCFCLFVWFVLFVLFDCILVCLYTCLFVLIVCLFICLFICLIVCLFVADSDPFTAYCLILPLLGIGPEWWMDSHNIHHVVCNDVHCGEGFVTKAATVQR